MSSGKEAAAARMQQQVHGALMYGFTEVVFERFGRGESVYFDVLLYWILTS
jgi:hypothetical protein